MKKLIGILLVLMLVTVACGGDDGAVDYNDPESIENCDDMVDAGMALLQDFLNDVAELDLAALASDEPPAEFIQVMSTGNALRIRAGALNCDPAVLDAGIVENAGDLEIDSSNVIGQFIMTAIQSGGGAFFAEGGFLDG